MDDAQTLLLRALRTHGARELVLHAAHSESWASATFVGARHRFAFAPAEPMIAGAFADSIGQADLVLPGHLVADITVSRRAEDAGGTALTIEALTVEDG